MPKAEVAPRTVNRRQFLSLATAAAFSATKSGHPIIDTHLEVWTFDPKFPFHHPEQPDLKHVPVEAPIENEVAEMREFGLKYAVLINPRYYGWDNSYISYSLHKFPGLFVAHGLLNPLGDDPAGRLRYWMEEQGFQGMRFSPIYHPHSSWLNSRDLYPLWREAERLGAVFNFYILPQQMPMLEDMAGRFPGVIVCSAIRTTKSSGLLTPGWDRRHNPCASRATRRAIRATQPPKPCPPISPVSTPRWRARRRCSMSQNATGWKFRTPRWNWRDSELRPLVKARVNVHTFDGSEVRKLTDAGVEIAAKSYQAGVAALRERDSRRKGWGMP